MFSISRRHIWREIDAYAAVFPCAEDFLDRPFWVQEGNMRDREKAFRIFSAKVCEPAVIGLRIGGCEFWVRDWTFPANADRRVQQGNINAFFIHHFEASFGIVAASRTALGVGHFPVGMQGDG